MNPIYSTHLRKKNWYLKEEIKWVMEMLSKEINKKVEKHKEM